MNPTKRTYAISKDKLKLWLESHYGEVRARGRHLTVNDPVGKPDGRPDTGFNLVFWPEGCCFKSWLPPNRSGNIINWVIETDKVDFSVAVGLVCEDRDFTDYERTNRVLEEFKKNASRAQDLATQAQKQAVLLPPGFKTFLDPSANVELQKALYTKIVEERNIYPDVFGLGFVDVHDRTQRENNERWPDMTARIVIPFYDSEGRVMYWTARDTVGKNPKYWNAPLPIDEESRKFFVGREDAIWCSNWGKKKKIYVCEGSFDAMSLCLVGLDAIAIGGAKVTAKQLSVIQRMLKPEHVVIALDNDTAGEQMELMMAKEFRSRGWRVQMVRPPDGYKDWNELWYAWRAPGPMKAWIEAQEAPLTVALEVKRQILNALRKVKL